MWSSFKQKQEEPRGGFCTIPMRNDGDTIDSSLKIEESSNLRCNLKNE